MLISINRFNFFGNYFPTFVDVYSIAMPKLWNEIPFWSDCKLSFADSKANVQSHQNECIEHFIEPNITDSFDLLTKMNTLRLQKMHVKWQAHRMQIIMKLDKYQVLIAQT